MNRLNSGVRGVDNFSGQSNFIIKNIENDSVNQAESGDKKILVWFHGNSILKIFQSFSNCVGGAYCVGVAHSK